MYNSNTLLSCINYVYTRMPPLLRRNPQKPNTRPPRKTYTYTYPYVCAPTEIPKGPIHKVHLLTYYLSYDVVKYVGHRCISCVRRPRACGA